MRNEIIQSAKRLRAKSLANEVNNMHVEQTDGYAAADPGHVGLDHADVGVLRNRPPLIGPSTTFQRDSGKRVV